MLSTKVVKLAKVKVEPVNKDNLSASSCIIAAREFSSAATEPTIQMQLLHLIMEFLDLQ